MNESLGADPTEALNAGVQLRVPGTLDIDYPERQSDPSLEPRREGLPPGFRMRHDTHYVEELMSTSTISKGSAYGTGARLSPAASAPLVNDGQKTIDAPTRPSPEAVDLIARRLESMVAHDVISRGHAAPADLIGRTVQAELQRVSRFARAVAISVRQQEPVRRSVTVGEIATAVRSACTRVARLTGVECLVTTDDPGFAIAIERALVVQGIAGTVDALIDLVQTTAVDTVEDDRGRMTVALHTARARPALFVDIECPALAWRASSADRFFDNSEQDFATAPAAGILLASAAHIVRLHGGRAEVQVQRGVSVRYVFPQETSAGTAVS